MDEQNAFATSDASSISIFLILCSVPQAILAGLPEITTFLGIIPLTILPTPIMTLSPICDPISIA